MDYQTHRMTTTLLSLAMTERLDAIIAEAAAADGDPPYALTSYSRIIDWAADLACEYGTTEQWTHATRDAAHTVANLGPLTLVEIGVSAMRTIEVALAGEQVTAMYTPTPSTAIAWFLDVARAAGFEAPGEDVR